MRISSKGIKFIQPVMDELAKAGRDMLIGELRLAIGCSHGSIINAVHIIKARELAIIKMHHGRLSVCLPGQSDDEARKKAHQLAKESAFRAQESAQRRRLDGTIKPSKKISINDEPNNPVTRKETEHGTTLVRFGRGFKTIPAQRHQSGQRYTSGLTYIY